ncbi:cytochrome b [Cupriavidus sp. 30B13]|uniref:cytochrome b n=1 Tax=Cupriavidus sp. 30B13 TaxID=3384241 RepID=UPI003B905BC0
MTSKYPKSTVFFHWTIAALVLLAYFSINLRGPRGSAAQVFWSGIHFWAGTLVLLLSVLRFGWRAPARARTVETSRLLRGLASLVHVLLYVFTLVQPVLGILNLNLGGHPVHLSGIGVSFRLVGANAALRPLVHGLHIYLGIAFYAVIGLHAAAALWHHFARGDDTLRRML